MTRRFASRDAHRRANSDDAGFSLIELVTSMAVFSILVIIVGAAMLAAFSAIRDTTARSDAQAQAQNATEWSSRLLRFSTTPLGQTGAIVDASKASITFYSDAGLAGRNDAPAKVRLYVQANADGTQTVRSQVWAPTQTSTGWTWAATATSRDLLTVPKGATTPLAVSVYVCDPNVSCYSPETCAAMVPTCTSTTWRDATPVTSGALALGATELPKAVRITVGDARYPELQVTQTVRLVNLL